MKVHSNSRRLPLALKRTLQLWAVITLGVLLFAATATVLSIKGSSHDQSILTALAVAGTATFLVLFFSGILDDPFSSKEYLAHNKSFGEIVRRLYLTFAGASKFDLVADVMRIAGVIGLAAIVLLQHGTNLITLKGGLLFTLIFLISLSFILFHGFVYPFVRKESIWEFEYRYRKLLMATSVNDVANASVHGINLSDLQEVELSMLKAIKSFVEFAALDKSRKNINVNLIVEHPYDSNMLVNIQRTNQDKPVPTFYKKTSMPTMMRVIGGAGPIYVGKFTPTVSTEKDYKMVWQIPVLLRLQDGERRVCVIAIDSKIPDHLDLEDRREALLFNLMPYIALVRFSLMRRYVHHVWDDVKDADAVMGRSYYEQMNAEEKEEYLEYIKEVAQTDRDLDAESLHISYGPDEDYSEKMGDLLDDIKSLPFATAGRRAFGALFPYVENHNRKIHS
jgi:hypothetical protein